MRVTSATSCKNLLVRLPATPPPTTTTRFFGVPIYHQLLVLISISLWSTPNRLMASCSSPGKFTNFFNEVPTKPVVRQTSPAIIHQNLPTVCISDVSHAISCWHGMANWPSRSDIRIVKFRYLEEGKYREMFQNWDQNLYILQLYSESSKRTTMLTMEFVGQEKQGFNLQR